MDDKYQNTDHLVYIAMSYTQTSHLVIKMDKKHTTPASIFQKSNAAY